MFYLIRDVTKKFYCKKIEENKDDMKGTWKILKQSVNKGNNATTCIDSIVHENQTITDTKLMPEIFNDHFVDIGEKLANKIDETRIDPLENLPETEKRFTLKIVNPNKVYRAISELKNGKSTGIDNFLNQAFKVSKDVVTNSLTDILNTCIKHKIFPRDFKVGRVTPIFKAGEKEELNNYRPITVLPTIARIFEKLIYEQLYSYLVNSGLLGNQQWGFRSLHSTVLALNISTDSWLMSINKGRLNSVVLLDIKKAFDTVNHDILIKELNRYRISNN